MSEVLQIPDQTALDATALRAYEDACLLTVFSSKLITEANCRCLYDGERGPLIDPGPWMFLVRLGEGTPALDPDADGLLWTSVAEIEARGHDVRRAPGPPWTPSAVAIPHPGSSKVHATHASALEAIAGFEGTGIAICVDPWSARNDGILRALTARLELRPPDDTRKVVWYYRPPRPLFAPGTQNRDAGECP